jgi:hypothetical protein
MTDPNQEYQSLDELFRKTFDKLPDSPAPSGWDAPSERVWRHVERNIQPPKSGWTLQAIGLVSAFAVTLAVGLYLYMARPAAQQDAIPTALPAAETPAVSEPSPAATLPAPAATPAAKQPAKPQPEKPKQSAPAAPNSAEENAADAKRPSSPTAAPLPGTKPASPNSTERQRSEGGKKDGGGQE